MPAQDSAPGNNHAPIDPGGGVGESTAHWIVEAFASYNAEFRAITRRAPDKFDQRDLKGSQRDAVERIELYDRFVTSTVAEIRLKLGEQALDQAIWRTIRRAFVSRVEGLPDNEFTKTFFSSITRRLFRTVGVAPELEFVATELDPLASVTSEVIKDVYTNRGALALLIEDLLDNLRYRSRWRDFDHSVEYVTTEIERYHSQTGERRNVQRVEVVRPVFYQVGRAYVVGRVIGRGYVRPLVIALKNTERGILVDAVIMNEDDVSILFGFTRSYFHVDLDRVGEAVVFLKQLLPRKPVSELFTVLGRAKQGKTERYRELMRHLGSATDRFVHAPGERGLVMVCFTLPSFDIVFKVIRDRFAYPKTVLREEVLAKYRFVFKHDRAGRLVDAQEFKRLRFKRDLFAPKLIEELMSETADTVHTDGDDLIFDHLYIERRMTPLNLYLRQASPAAAERAVIDYGQAIRDLAYTNIFAGDLLLKNFGVTRHGRVIFYDYDELCQLSDCRFRDLPQAQNEDDEMRGEPWFYVADNDVFPETFIKFLSFDATQQAAFLRVHGDVLTADFWRQLQTRIAEDEVLEVLPYSHHRVRVASSG